MGEVVYKHISPDRDELRVEEGPDYCVLDCTDGADNDRVRVVVTNASRRQVAAAVAGDKYQVVEQIPDWERELLSGPRPDVETMQRDLRKIMAELGMSLHARSRSSHDVVIREVLPRIREVMVKETDRPEPVDPAEVKVGDVVEVTQQHDDLNLRITVEGEVYQTEDSSHPFHIRGYGAPAIGDMTTVRILRRAEPEPDPAQVEALADLLDSLPPEMSSQSKARELIGDGVRVVSPDE